MSLASATSSLQKWVRLGYQNHCLHTLKCLCYSCTVMRVACLLIECLFMVCGEENQWNNSNKVQTVQERKIERGEEMQDQDLKHHCNSYYIPILSWLTTGVVFFLYVCQEKVLFYTTNCSLFSNQ